MNAAVDEVPGQAEVFPSSLWHLECTLCGACCAAPDISTLQKPLGVPCKHLDSSCRCTIYAARPQVCRGYTPDWVCGEVAPLPTLAERVQRYLEIYGLERPARKLSTSASVGSEG
ncbi:MAG: YkgJ family cysteine cluster protein [Deinococcota bacterium]